MIQTLQLLLRQLAGCLRSRAELEFKNFVLCHQIEILRRSAPKRARLVGTDRFVFTLLIRLWPRPPVDPNRASDDIGALASCGVQDVLAMEVEITQRAAKDD